MVWYVDTTSLRLVGAQEIRELVGCLSRQRVYQLTRRRDFPTPAAELAQGTVWLADEVEAWLADRRRSPLNDERRPSARARRIT